MSLFQPTTTTFGDAKTTIAEQASKQNTSEFLTRAGKSLQRAVKYWNKYNWRWLCKQIAISANASASSYALPFDFKDVYNLQVTTSGRRRTLTGIPRRVYDRVVPDPSDVQGNELCGYDLFTQGDVGHITVQPAPTTDDTLALRYYRRMWVPCTVSATVIATGNEDTVFGSATGVGAWSGLTNSSPVQTLPAGWVKGSGITHATAGLLTPITLQLSGANMTAVANTSGLFVFGGDNWHLDIPEDYENGILAWATHNFLSGLGAPDKRLNYYIQLANDEFQEARAANERFEDQDIAFEFGKPGSYPRVFPQ